VGDATGTAVLIENGDLRLGVRAEPRNEPTATVVRQALRESMGQHDRKRHQLGCLVRGIAKQNALVTGPLVLGSAIDRMTYFGRLLGQGQKNLDGVGAKGLTRIGVADLPDGLTDNPLVINLALASDLTSNDDQIAFAEYFTGHPTLDIFLQVSVYNRISDEVRNLVRMAF
jgi:hypothetical protein